MPIKIANTLPARAILEQERIFVMTEDRAAHQDIRPLKILVLNLMPTKQVTETQICRCLSNTPLQIEVELLQVSSHHSKNTPPEHLLSFYKSFPDVKHLNYDGMIITGAPVEKYDFEEVDYWPELCDIMEWSKTHVHSVFHICWGAQAALYYHYGIHKVALPKKLSGVYAHAITDRRIPLVRGFDDRFLAPHSRYTDLDLAELLADRRLQIAAISDEAGPYVIIAKEGRQIFVTGHSEYDPCTLRDEYIRDLEKGINPDIPKNYFPNNDPTAEPLLTWRSHATLLYTNWLNYYVYQSTPFDLTKLEGSL